MAAPPCMSNDGRPAVMVATMLTNGDAFALCDECIVPWAASLLAVMAGVDPTPFLAAVSDDGGQAETETLIELDEVAPTLDDEPDPPPANGRSGRSRKESPAAGMETDLDADGPATQPTPDPSTA